MAVYYRYKSGVDTFSVPVPSPSISVADLKRLILATPRHGHGRTHGRGPREGVALSDARTGEEYADDGALVARSSTVLVRRVVAGPPAETITVASPPPPPGAGSSSSSAEDDEERAIGAVIDAAQLEWEDQRACHGARRFAHRGAVELRPPPGYVCHRCRVPGHFIQHCPTNGDPRFDLRRAPPATTRPAPASVVSACPDDSIPTELHCKICKKAMADAVVAARCCFGSFCDGCIRGHIAGKSKCLCGSQARADDLVPNLTLRATIANLLATKTTASGSSGTEKPRGSSSGGNAEPATQQSLAASPQESSSNVTAGASISSEHSNGSASSTSKGGAAVLAAAKREARRTKQATAESAAQIMAGPGYPGQQYAYGGGPFGPACYDPFFGAAPWAPDAYSCYGVPYGGGYPIGPAPTSHHDGGRGSKRTAGDYRSQEEPGFKRRCGSRSMIAV